MEPANTGSDQYQSGRSYLIRCCLVFVNIALSSIKRIRLESSNYAREWMAYTRINTNRFLSFVQQYYKSQLELTLLNKRVCFKNMHNTCSYKTCLLIYSFTKTLYSDIPVWVSLIHIISRLVNIQIVGIPVIIIAI